MIKSLDDIKRERTSKFREIFNINLGEGEKLQLRKSNIDLKLDLLEKRFEYFILETIDLINQRTKAVVEEVIGADDQEIHGLVVHEGAVFCNRLRAEMRLRATALLKEDNEHSERTD